MKNYHNDAPLSVTAEKLDQLASREDRFAEGPVGLLRKLIDEVQAAYGVDRNAALKLISEKGVNWLGGYEGRIAVRVIKKADGTFDVRWSTEGTNCRLGELIYSIELDNEVPDWFENEWIEYEA